MDDEVLAESHHIHPALRKKSVYLIRNLLIRCIFILIEALFRLEVGRVWWVTDFMRRSNQY